MQKLEGQERSGGAGGERRGEEERVKNAKIRRGKLETLTRERTAGAGGREI